MATTAIYTRISRDRDDTRGGVDRQRSDCRKLCETKGWRDVVVFEDNDLSAYSGKRRPRYEELLAEVRSGSITRIVAWHPDRLHRSLRELEDFIDVIESARCEVVTVTAGDYDLSTVEGRMIARIVGSVARAESEHKARRLRRKHEQLADAGAYWGGGRRWYGYRPVLDGRGKVASLKVVAREAKIIREVFSRYLAGEGISPIGHDLNRRGIKPVGGGLWTGTTLRRMVGAVRLAGQREYRGRIVAEGTWPAIVTLDEVTRARALLAASAKRHPNQRSARTRVLSGLVICSSCDCKMVSGTTKAGHPRYVCSGGVGKRNCGRMAIIAEPLEQLVVETVLLALDSPRYAKAMKDRARADRVDAGDVARVDDVEVVRAAEAQLAELADAYADRDISLSEWVQARNRVEARADEARGRIADSVRPSAAPYAEKPGLLRDAWPKLPLATKNAILDDVLEQVRIRRVTKAGRVPFAGDRVDVIWKA